MNIYYISTSRYNDIQNIRQYQKPIFRYNYIGGILLNTNSDPITLNVYKIIQNYVNFDTF